MRNGKHKIRVLPQHISYVHLATVRAMYWISTNNLCYGSTSVLRWHISSNSVGARSNPMVGYARLIITYVDRNILYNYMDAYQ